MMGNCFHSQTVHETSNWALGPTFYPSKVLLSPPFALLEDRFCVISRSDLSVAASADQKRAEFRTGRSRPLAYSLAPGLSVVFSRHLSSRQTCHRPPPTEATGPPLSASSADACAGSCSGLGRRRTHEPGMRGAVACLLQGRLRTRPVSLRVLCFLACCYRSTKNNMLVHYALRS